MKFGRTLSLVLCATVAPAIAWADDPVDPYAPQPAPTTSTTAPTQNPPAPSTNTTVVTPTPAPQPQQQPVVVVPPPQQVPAPSHTTIVTQPEGTEVSDSWNAPVFATGALVFAGSYGASAVVAGSSNHVGADRLYVPVVGPWLALNDWGDCPIDQPRCDKNTTDKVLLVADGVFQAAGVITMVSGLLSPTHHTVYTRTADLKPKLTPTHNGVAVIGRF